MLTICTEEAQAAVSICKFPPRLGASKLVIGKRSLTAGVPHFGYKPTSPAETMTQLDASGSCVVLMIKTADSIENLDAIATVPGVDMLLIGANDLSLELGIQEKWDDPLFKDTLNRVTEACKNSGIVMGLAGLYTRPDICEDAINRLGVRYILGNLDIALIAAAAKTNVAALRALER